MTPLQLIRAILYYGPLHIGKACTCILAGSVVILPCHRHLEHAPRE